jgi:type II secretory pathway pseudopilin PulG
MMMSPALGREVVPSRKSCNRQSPRWRGPIGNRQLKQCRAGYTLIELLMIVALLGLAASLLIPYMVGRTSLEAQAVVRMIIADLHFAQHDALAHQEYRRVYFFDDGSGYALISIGARNEPFAPNTADYLFHTGSPGANLDRYIVDLSNDTRFSDVTITTANFDGGNRFITYDEMGGTIAPTGEPGGFGVITITSPEATYQISVSPFTGKLTVERIS